MSSGWRPMRREGMVDHALDIRFREGLIISIFRRSRRQIPTI